MKVKISKERITHYQALCHNCGWVEADHVDREWLRQEVHKHVRNTGHSVSIEKGTSTLYEAAEQKMHPTKNGRTQSDSESKLAVFSG